MGDRIRNRIKKLEDISLRKKAVYPMTFSNIGNDRRQHLLLLDIIIKISLV